LFHLTDIAFGAIFLRLSGAKASLRA